MKLEYRILEIAQGNEQECNFCFLDFDDPTILEVEIKIQKLKYFDFGSMVEIKSRNDFG